MLRSKTIKINFGRDRYSFLCFPDVPEERSIGIVVSVMPAESLKYLVLCGHRSMIRPSMMECVSTSPRVGLQCAHVSCDGLHDFEDQK